MTAVLLTTRLKVSDPTAMTALGTLRDRMGMKDVLAGLSREELYLLRVDLTAATARGRVESLVRRTNLFLNPNKHAWRLDVEGEGAETPPVPDPARAWLLVHGRLEETDLLESLWRHAGEKEITELHRAWLWRFDAAPGVSAGSLRRAAERAALVTGRTEGFLVHPAFQEGRLYAAPPNLYDIQSFLSATQKEGPPAE